MANNAIVQAGIEPDAASEKNDAENGGHRVPILLQYWDILWRRRLIVLGALGLSLLAGAIATGMATPIYTAVTKIEISREQARVTNVEGLESERAGQTQEFYSTQYELLRSRTLAERVVRKLGLARSNEFFALHGADVEGGGSSAAKVGLSPADAKAREQRAVALVQANVEVQPVRGSALVTIAYSSPDPVWSSRIANTWASEFIQNSLDRRFASTAEARAFLEKRLQDLRLRLDQSERELVDYAVSRNIITLKEAKGEGGATQIVQTLTGADLEALNQQLAEATVDRVQGANVWLTVGLREGKNREVKRVLAHLGLDTNRLIRISYGPFQLGDLEDGEVREIRGRVLRDQLGEKLATAAGADFEAAVRLPAPPVPKPVRPGPVKPKRPPSAHRRR